tara:strand:- start:908 stop:1738 length:831 start_codon:yes stop_codon:yes gene_type:complete
MTFFNKKQEVVDVQLTRFGRNLLARGAFKPEYYQFFDDDIIYNIERVGTSEDQNDSETRIKDGIRLRTQHTTISLEDSFKYQQDLIKEGLRGVFLKIRRQVDPLEADKLLKYPLGNYKAGSQVAPNFILKTVSAKITGSLKYPDPFEKGIYKNRPEINIEPSYKYIIDRRNVSDPEDVVVDSEAFIDVTKDKIEFLDGSTITLQKKDFIIDFEEFAASYGLDNFEIEIYEETEPGSEEYILMVEEKEIYDLLNIKVDESVKETKGTPDKSRNFYSE